MGKLHRRMKPGEILTITDQTGKESAITVLSVNGDVVELAIVAPSDLKLEHHGTTKVDRARDSS